MIIHTKGTLLRDQAPPVGEPSDILAVLVPEHTPVCFSWSSICGAWCDKSGDYWDGSDVHEAFSHYHRAAEAAWLIIREGDPEDDALLAAAREQDTRVAMALPGGHGTLWSQSDGIETQIGDFTFRVSGHSMRHELVRVTMSHPDKRTVTMDIPFDALAEFVVGELQNSRARRGNG